MEHLPIFLSVRDQLCVVIGGGEIATRKVALLLRAGGRVQVIAPTLCRSLAKFRDEGRVEHLARAYVAGDLEDAYLAFAATDDETVNREVAETGRSLRIPVNVVDHPEHGSFIMPSMAISRTLGSHWLSSMSFSDSPNPAASACPIGTR